MTDAAITAKAVFIVFFTVFFSFRLAVRIRTSGLRGVRTGKFPQISRTERGKVEFVNLIGAKTPSGATITENDLLWPISLNEMQRNPNLRPQNPGYQEAK